MDIRKVKGEDAVLMISGKPTYEEGIKVLRMEAISKYGVDGCRNLAEAEGLPEGYADEACVDWVVFATLKEKVSKLQLH